MSHLEKDIIKGKFGKNPQLKKEAREEEVEEDIRNKTGKKVKIREVAGKMKMKGKFDPKKDLTKYMKDHKNDKFN